MEQLIHRELAVEDVAADQAELLLHVVGPDHLAVDHRVAEVRRQRRVAVDRAVGVGLQLLAMRLLVPLVRHPLAEHREDVHALGRQSLVDRRRDRAVDERTDRRAMLEVGILERALGVVARQAQLDRAGVVVLQVRAGVRGEVRQLAHRHVDLHDARARLPVLDVEHEVLGQVGAIHQLEERDLGMHAAHHDRRAQFLAGVERDADGAAALDQDAFHPRVGADLGAERGGRVADRIGHRAHAALREPPVHGVAVAPPTSPIAWCSST